MALWLFLAINPEPWAVGPIQPVRRGGKIAAFMGKNQQLATFQEAVREAVREQWADLPTLQGNIDLAVYLWRERASYTTTSDRKHRKHEADATNMLKGIEDALQGVLFDNDRDNISVHSHIMQQDENTAGKIVLRLEVVDAEKHRRSLIQGMPPSIVNDIMRHELNTQVGPSSQDWGDEEALF